MFGGAVNVAARIAAESAPGEVLVSQTVRDLARRSAGVSFDPGGERELKGRAGAGSGLECAGLDVPAGNRTPSASDCAPPSKENPRPAKPV